MPNKIPQISNKNMYHVVTDSHTSTNTPRSPLMASATNGNRNAVESYDDDDAFDEPRASSVDPTHARKPSRHRTSSAAEVVSTLRTGTPNHSKRSRHETPNSRIKKSKPREPVSEADPVRTALESPVIVAVDKLHLCVPMSPQEMHGAIDRALDMVKSKKLTKGGLKSEFHNYKFVLPMPSGEKAVLLLAPNKPNMKWPMLLRLNPHEITDDDSKVLLAMFKTLFPNGALRIAASMRIARIDECADAPHKIENLIIERDGSKVGSKFFIGTGAKAQIQSSYMGSVKSDDHGHAYDKVACDPQTYAAKLLSKKFPPRDAALHIESGRGLTRIENRRLFAQPVTLKEFAALQNPFGDYQVTDLSKFAGRKLDLDFLTYLDCVRLRGVNGALRFLKDGAGRPTDTSERIAAMEKKLSKAAADWWPPEAHNASAMKWLKNSPIWRFVCVMQPKSIRKKSH